jgi:hypothetical protein
MFEPEQKPSKPQQKDQNKDKAKPPKKDEIKLPRPRPIFAINGESS